MNYLLLYGTVFLCPACSYLGDGVTMLEHLRDRHMCGCSMEPHHHRPSCPEYAPRPGWRPPDPEETP